MCYTILLPFIILLLLLRFLVHLSPYCPPLSPSSSVFFSSFSNSCSSSFPSPFSVLSFPPLHLSADKQKWHRRKHQWQVLWFRLWHFSSLSSCTLCRTINGDEEQLGAELILLILTAGLSRSSVMCPQMHFLVSLKICVKKILEARFPSCCCWWPWWPCCVSRYRLKMTTAPASPPPPSSWVTHTLVCVLVCVWKMSENFTSIVEKNSSILLWCDCALKRNVRNVSRVHKVWMHQKQVQVLHCEDQ